MTRPRVDGWGWLPARVLGGHPHLWPLPRPNGRGYYADRAWLDELAPNEGESMHPGQPRDVDLDEWLNGIGFHPANSSRKQLGHEAARQLVADLGRMLHGLLPAGRDKSLAFTNLEDVLMRANRALALGGGPRDDLDDDTLQRLASHGPLEEDPRVSAYKAQQRGETTEAEILRDGEGNVLPLGYRSPAGLREDETDAGAVLLDDGPAAPTETYREEIQGGGLDVVKLQVAGSIFRAGGYVDVAVVCTDRGHVQTVLQDPHFDGFHKVLDTPEQVQHAVNAILEAAERAGLGRWERSVNE